MIFDSYYDDYRGVILYVRTFDGSIQKGDAIEMLATSATGIALEVGALEVGAERLEFSAAAGTEAAAGELGERRTAGRMLHDAGHVGGCVGASRLGDLQRGVRPGVSSHPIHDHVHVEQLLLDPLDPFGNGGHLNMLVGMKVPYNVDFRPTDREKQAWEMVRERYRKIAMGGFTVEEALKVIRGPGWRWPSELYVD